MYKVFLVDDEELIVKQIVDSVPWMDNGFEVIGVETNPKRAIEKVVQLKPDVVFSDLKMPLLDGHELMKLIRESGVKTEFVMLSAYGTFEDAKTFFHQEGFDYLLKPLQLEEVQLVLEKLAGILAVKRPQKEVTVEDNINPAFLELIAYVKVNFTKKLTLDKLGKSFGLSAGYICNLFARHYNTTLTCFITELRMKKAVELIESSNDSLKNIAFECGYSDYFYFNKVFKGYIGMAPSQYIQMLEMGKQN